MTAEVKLDEKDIFNFLIYHMYFNTTGWLYIIVGIVALGGGIFYIVRGNFTGIFLVLVAVVYFVLMPGMLYVKARSQAKNEIFQKTTYYMFDEQGIHAAQEDVGSSVVELTQLNKIVKFRKSYLIYVDATRANIIPLSCFHQSETEVDAYFKSYMPKNRLKGIR